MIDRDRLFWEAVRRALLAFVKAIEVRYLEPPEVKPRQQPRT